MPSRSMRSACSWIAGRRSSGMPVAGPSTTTARARPGCRAAELGRLAGAARVVAEHRARTGQERQDELPALERSAHLVDEDERLVARTGPLVAETDAPAL